jgi:homocysteine S-methyltransferase
VVLTEPVVLDGGLATELQARGHDLSDRLWSARLLLTDPAAIEDVHLAYFRSGAQVATTASYQASVEGFASAGLDRADALKAIRLSVELAVHARERFADESGADPSDLVVAGSVGPYGAMLADGSEYTGAYDPGTAALRDFHGPRIDALNEAGADLLALETIPTVREAAVVIDLVRESGSRAWLSYQCRDERFTAAGEPIEEAVALANGEPGIVAVGVNCTAPHLVPSLLRRAATATDRPLVAYPNDGDRWDARSRGWIPSTADRAFDPAAVATWTDLGARWLGGCCGTTPADIGGLAAALGLSRRGGDPSPGASAR